MNESNETQSVLVDGKHAIRVSSDFSQFTGRRTHVCVPSPSGYEPLCAVDGFIDSFDRFYEMRPSEFGQKDNHCRNCQLLLSERVSQNSEGVGQLEYDPFANSEGGHVTLLEQSTQNQRVVSVSPASPESVLYPEESPVSLEGQTEEIVQDIVCQDCGDTFDTDKSLTLHWTFSSSCEYPVASEREQALLTGLWLAGGSVRKQGSHPVLRKASVKEDFLRDVKTALGVWGSDVSMSADGETQSEKLGTLTGGSHDSRPLYRLTTRTCPWLEKLTDASIHTVELPPAALNVLFCFSGHVIDNSVITLRHGDGFGLAARLEEMGFQVKAIRYPDEGKSNYRVRLSASGSRNFIKYIGEPLDGTEFEMRPHRSDWVDSTAHVSSGAEETQPDTTSQTEKISLEPNWEWLGVQLTRLGMVQFARRAFNQNLTPKDVYGSGGVEDIIWSAYHSGQNQLDITTSSGGSTHEQPVSPAEIKKAKERVL